MARLACTSVCVWPCYKHNNYLAYDTPYLCRKRVTNVIFGFVSLNGSVDQNLSMRSHRAICNMLLYTQGYAVVFQ